MSDPQAMPVVIGVGSPIGEDCVGWSAVELLRRQHQDLARYYLATAPHQLIDWIAPADRLHLIDGVVGGDLRWGRHVLQHTGAVGNVARSAGFSGQLSAPNADQEQETLHFDRTDLPWRGRLASASSHQLDLLTVLRLAFTLDRLPTEVVLWTIPIEPAGPTDSPGQIGSHRQLRPETDAAVKIVVRQLAGELSHA